VEADEDGDVWLEGEEDSWLEGDEDGWVEGDEDGGVEAGEDVSGGGVVDIGGGLWLATGEVYVNCMIRKTLSGNVVLGGVPA